MRLTIPGLSADLVPCVPKAASEMLDLAAHGVPLGRGSTPSSSFELGSVRSGPGPQLQVTSVQTKLAKAMPERTLKNTHTPVYSWLESPFFALGTLGKFLVLVPTELALFKTA